MENINFNGMGESLSPRNYDLDVFMNFCSGLDKSVIKDINDIMEGICIYSENTNTPELTFFKTYEIDNGNLLTVTIVIAEDITQLYLDGEKVEDLSAIKNEVVSAGEIILYSTKIADDGINLEVNTCKSNFHPKWPPGTIELIP